MSYTTEDQSTYTKATLTGLEKEETNEGKVLGVLWNKTTDTFIFRFDQLIELARKLPPTKRNVLRLTASVFDPLGIISPVIMQMKLLFQSLCSQNYGWDTPLSEEHLNVFQQWVNELDNIRSIIVPRYYAYEVQENIVSYKLVGFGDASVKGYCAVIYFVYDTVYEFCSSQLMCTKSRVCPLGEITVPRLELIAADVLAHLIVNVKEALRDDIPNFDQITCFGDNTGIILDKDTTRI